MTTRDLIEKYGSDKNLSKYTEVYDYIFPYKKSEKGNFLEIGVGSLLPESPATFSGNINFFPHYTPGGSLRAWRDYFPNMNVYGLDVGKDCLLKEDRIETFICDSTDYDGILNIFPETSFNIIIDDGSHKAYNQYRTLMNFYPMVVEKGFYIVEDVGGGGDGLNFFMHYEDELTKYLKNDEYWLGGNILVINKNNSQRGRLGFYKDFNL